MQISLYQISPTRTSTDRQTDRRKSIRITRLKSDWQTARRQSINRSTSAANRREWDRPGPVTKATIRSALDINSADPTSDFLNIDRFLSARGAVEWRGKRAEGFPEPKNM